MASCDLGIVCHHYALLGLKYSPPLFPLLDSRQAFPFSGAGISGKRWSPVVRYLLMLLLYTVRSVPSSISIAKLGSLLLVVTVFVVMSQSVGCICMLGLAVLSGFLVWSAVDCRGLWYCSSIVFLPL